MSQSDPIADMLTRIRNAQGAEQEVVTMPSSKMKAEIARLLKKEGFVSDFAVEGDKRRTLRIYLKYDVDHVPVIRGLRRLSRPGLRRYSGAVEMPRVLGGLGVTIISTSEGIMSGKEAKKRNIGGEILCSVW